MPNYAIRITSPDLIFSAGHFITFADGGVEPLHGHDYRVTAEIRGPLGPAGYLIDFTEVHGLLKALLGELDHRVLLPDRHSMLKIEPSGKEYLVTYANKRWIFPQADCRLLPVLNTTAEALAEYLAQRLWEGLQLKNPDLTDYVRVEVGEGTGFAGVYTLSEKLTSSWS
jgi:6-pyruvoyltetrahydropterin/6-carboxytetrahydropterin synthase